MTTNNTLARTRVCCLLLAAALSHLGMTPVIAEEIFLQSAWLNVTPGPPPGVVAVAIWAGGNESTGTTNDSPCSANGICLAESAIGQMTAQTAAYPNAAADLAVLGDTYRTNAVVYHYTNFGSGLVAIPATAWNVVFPGGFNPHAPLAGPYTYAAGAASTYDSNLIEQADYALRARLEVNPGDVDAAQKLVLLVEDRILPIEWGAMEAMCYATYARLQPGPVMNNGRNVETIAVEYARGYFSNACNNFVQFLSNPINADLVEGQNPLLSASVLTESAQVAEDFLRNLSGYAEASLLDFQLRSFADFYDPTVTGNTSPAALLSDIDATVNQVQLLLLLAGPFQTNLPPYTLSTVGRIRGIVHDLGRLHQSIVLGRVTFNAGASGTSDPSNNYGEFTTAFVPFFATTTGENSSFDVALALAAQFAADASSAELSASNNITQVLNLQYNWAADQVNLQNQYLSQLENLCGTVKDTNGDTFADVFTAGLQSGFPIAPGPRELVITDLQKKGIQFNYSGGLIYQQWQAVETAQTNLFLATVQLSNTFNMMVKDTQVADAIYSNQVRLAQLILTNGQQIAAIDVQEGQVQAQADLAIAQIQATAAQTEAENSAFGQLGGVIGFSTKGGVSVNPGAVTGAAATLANGYDQAAADLAIGQVQANEATQLVALSAQIEQITADEQAQEMYVNADTTMLNLSSHLATLQGQAQGQAVQIQLAAQAVDQERSKLANLMSQVGSLLSQWARSQSLMAANPAFSSDLLLIRDDQIQKANDAFALAQQWAFLAALCFNYKDNCQNEDNSFNFVARVLAARNAGDLKVIVSQMKSDITLVSGVPTISTACTQGSVQYVTSSVLKFSLRNNFVQANQVQTIQISGTNVVITNYSPVVVAGTVLTDAAGSLRGWTNYLASNVSGGPGNRSLKLYFSTSLNAQWVNGIQRNPLFNNRQFGSTLYSGSDYNGGQLHGVQVGFVLSGFSGDSSQGFQVYLAQAGTSSIRNRGYCNTLASGPGFRYFNFGNYIAGITASIGNLSGNSGTAALQDRSAANSQWVLTMNEGDNPNNGALLFDNLAQLTDIQLGFNTRTYIDETCPP